MRRCKPKQSSPSGGGVREGGGVARGQSENELPLPVGLLLSWGSWELGSLLCLWLLRLPCHKEGQHYVDVQKAELTACAANNAVNLCRD